MTGSVVSRYQDGSVHAHPLVPVFNCMRTPAQDDDPVTSSGARRAHPAFEKRRNSIGPVRGSRRSGPLKCPCHKRCVNRHVRSDTDYRSSPSPTRRRLLPLSPRNAVVVPTRRIVLASPLGEFVNCGTTKASRRRVGVALPAQSAPVGFRGDGADGRLEVAPRRRAGRCQLGCAAVAIANPHASGRRSVALLRRRPRCR
jgi:hypothetical protein